MVRTAASGFVLASGVGADHGPHVGEHLLRVRRDRERWSSRIQDVTVEVPVQNPADLPVPRHRLPILNLVDLDPFEAGPLDLVIVVEALDFDRDLAVAFHLAGDVLADEDHGPIVHPTSTKVCLDHLHSPCEMCGVLVNHLAKARCQFILNDIL